MRVDYGRGQNRTLTPLAALWPPVFAFAGELDVGPPRNETTGARLERESQLVMPPRPDTLDAVVGQCAMAQQSAAVRKETVYRPLNRRLSPWRTILTLTGTNPNLASDRCETPRDNLGQTSLTRVDRLPTLNSLLPAVRSAKSRLHQRGLLLPS